MTQYKLFITLIQAILFFDLQAFAGFDRIPQPTAIFAKGTAGVADVNPLGMWINPAASGKNVGFHSAFFILHRHFNFLNCRMPGLLFLNRYLGQVLRWG